MTERATTSSLTSAFEHVADRIEIDLLNAELCCTIESRNIGGRLVLLVDKRRIGAIG